MGQHLSAMLSFLISQRVSAGHNRASVEGFSNHSAQYALMPASSLCPIQFAPLGSAGHKSRLRARPALAHFAMRALIKSKLV